MILPPLALANHDVPGAKVEIFDSQSRTFQQAQAGPIEQASHEFGTPLMRPRTARASPGMPRDGSRLTPGDATIWSPLLIL
jgi:hypothetical protein